MLMNTLDNFINRFQLILPEPIGSVQSINVDRAKKSAAVLLAIICKPEPTLLFTKRTETYAFMRVKSLFLVELENAMIIA